MGVSERIPFNPVKSPLMLLVGNQNADPGRGALCALVDATTNLQFPDRRHPAD